MKHIILITIIVLTLLVNVFSQPDILWTKTYGFGGFDIGRSVIETDDEGFIIIGTKEMFSGSGYDVWLLKTNAIGDTLWTKAIGGGLDDEGGDIQLTRDGGYIITGYTRSYGGGERDVWLIKTNSYGDTLWTRTFGMNNTDWAFSVYPTLDDGFIISGTTASQGAGSTDVWLIKTDSLGHTLWTKTFGGTDADDGYCVQQTSDGNYIIVAYTFSFGVGSADIWLIKTNDLGDTLWTRTYGGNQDDHGWSVRETSDSGYIIVGTTGSYGAGFRDVWIIKTDLNGDTLWTKTYGGGSSEWGFSVEQLSDDGYIISAYTSSFGAGSKDAWIIRTDFKGDTIWTKTIGGAEEDQAWSILQTSDYGYIITGFTKSFGSGEEDLWLIKLEPDSPNVIIDYDDILHPNFSLRQNYPNPFNPSTKIRYSIQNSSKVVIKVYDVLGNEVETLVNEEKPAGIYELTWYAEGFPSGVYFYQLQTKEFIETKKMILLK
jgi:hypothetical protein